MKRLVWLLLLAVGTALAQVSPVELPVTKAASCPCCQKSGDCGMPDCALPPATPAPAARTATPAISTVAKLAVPAPRGLKNHYYVEFSSRAPVRMLPAPAALLVSASVPLFQEHCSWLI